jgi:O-antigen/teichoic acid export membrane protein
LPNQNAKAEGKTVRTATRGEGILRNAAFTLIGSSVPLIVSIATIPYVMRGLGPDRFGVLALVWTVVGYFGYFDLGLGRATTKFVAEAASVGDFGRLEAVAGTTAGANAALGFVASVVVFSISGFLVDHVLKIPPGMIDDARRSFRILAVAIPLVLVSNGYRGVLEGMQRFDLVNLARMPLSAAIVVLPAVGVALHWSLPGIVLALVLSRMVAAVVHYVMYRLQLPPGPKARHARFALLRAIFSFSGWIAVSNTLIPLVVYLDRFALGAVISVGAVAYYAVPYEVVSKLLLIPAAVATVLFPAISTLASTARRDDMARTVGQATKLVAISVTPIAVLLILYSDQLLSLWAGAEYASRSAVVFRLLTAAMFLNSLAYAFVSLVEGAGRPDVVAKYHLMELPIYGIVLFALVRKFGIEGAAAALCLRMAWMTPIFIGLVMRASGLQPAAILRDGALVSACLGATLVLLTLLIRTFVYGHEQTIAILAVAIIGFYVVLTWQRVLSEVDRAFARRLFVRT